MSRPLLVCARNTILQFGGERERERWCESAWLNWSVPLINTSTPSLSPPPPPLPRPLCCKIIEFQFHGERETLRERALLHSGLDVTLMRHYLGLDSDVIYTPGSTWKIHLRAMQFPAQYTHGHWAALRMISPLDARPYPLEFSSLFSSLAESHFILSRHLAHAFDPGTENGSPLLSLRVSHCHSAMNFKKKKRVRLYIVECPTLSSSLVSRIDKISLWLKANGKFGSSCQTFLISVRWKIIITAWNGEDGNLLKGSRVETIWQFVCSNKIGSPN
jgi:hypothetical protein